MLFSVGRVYHKVIHNIPVFPFNYNDSVITSFFSVLTMCLDNFCVANIKENYFFFSFVNACHYRLLLLIILILLSAKVTQWLLKHIPVKYLRKDKISIIYKKLLLLYLPIIFLNILLNNELIIIILFTFFFNITICLFIIDLKTGYLPDILVYLLLWGGLIYQSCIAQGNVVSAVYAVVISYLSIMLITALMEKVRRRPQMGRGDFKLIAACAAWLGMMDLPYFLALAAMFGMIHHGFIYYVKRRTETLNTIPFGPAIVLSASYWLVAPLLNVFTLKMAS